MPLASGMSHACSRIREFNKPSLNIMSESYQNWLWTRQMEYILSSCQLCNTEVNTLQVSTKKSLENVHMDSKYVFLLLKFLQNMFSVTDLDLFSCKHNFVIFLFNVQCKFFSISASLGAMSPANHPQLPSNPYFRPGANLPTPPFFHPGMSSMMGRLPHGSPMMMPSTSHGPSMLQPQPTIQKPENQVSGLLFAKYEMISEYSWVGNAVFLKKEGALLCLKIILLHL